MNKQPVRLKALTHDMCVKRQKEMYLTSEEAEQYNIFIPAGATVLVDRNIQIKPRREHSLNKIRNAIKRKVYK